MAVIERYLPNWRDLRVHESSPTPRGASVRLARECKGYFCSQFFPGQVRGTQCGGVLCEDLSELTFPDESIDVHVTQDVMEHVFHPEQVFKEIARTLRPGGAHVFTVPIVRRHQHSIRRAMLRADGQIEHLLPPEYHGNPVDPRGSLVTMDWGFDICECIARACGLFTHVVVIDDLSSGIRADFIEVLVTMKLADSSARGPS